jgi:hypothetical protein
MSSRSGGKMFYPDQLSMLKEEILGSEYIRPVSYSQTSTVEIIDLTWLFWLIVFFFSLEWFFRKRYLTI